MCPHTEHSLGTMQLYRYLSSPQNTHSLAKSPTIDPTALLTPTNASNFIPFLLIFACAYLQLCSSITTCSHFPPALATGKEAPSYCLIYSSAIIE